MYQRSKHINPLSAVDYANLGSAFRKVGLYDRAMAEINTAISLDPEDWFYLYQLSNLHLYLENYEEMGRTVAKMVEVGDSSAAVLDWAAYLTHMYNPQLAWQYLENIEELEDYDVRNNYLVPVIKAYLMKTLSLPGNWKGIL